MNKANKTGPASQDTQSPAHVKPGSEMDKDRKRTPEPKTDRERAQHQDRVRVGRED